MSDIVSEEKITLDRDVFRVLASDTRVNILKSLDRRRKTLTELSKEFGMSVSTVKEHLDNLVRAGLIEQKDEGYKWKYYELTKKGKSILHPEDMRVWILLGVSVLGLAVTCFDLVRLSFTSSSAMQALGAGAIREGGELAVGKAAETVSGFPYMLHTAGLVLFGILLAVSAVYIAKRHSRALALS